MARHIDVEQEGDEAPAYLITIEYDEFLTRLDLDEIIGSIDRIIEYELLDYYEIPFPYFRRRFGRFYRDPVEPDFSYVGIRAIDSGSITLTVMVTSAVVLYVTRRFRKGVSESLLGEEVQRSGRLAGDVLGRLLGRINDWIGQYVPKQRELGGRVTKISIRRKDGTGRGRAKPKS